MEDDPGTGREKIILLGQGRRMVGSFVSQGEDSHTAELDLKHNINSSKLVVPLIYWLNRFTYFIDSTRLNLSKGINLYRQSVWFQRKSVYFFGLTPVIN